jgi:hypothetical protein
LYAGLISEFKLTPWQIAKLTDSQINRLYCHPRTEQGAIEPIEDKVEPDSLDWHMLKLEVAAASIHMPPAQLAEAKAKLRAKWEREGRGQ